MNLPHVSPPCSRHGFALFLAMMVTTLLLFLVFGARSVSRASLDLGRSAALESVAFQAADGGLERGLGRLHRSFAPCTFSYLSPLTPVRTVQVTVTAAGDRNRLDLSASATVLDAGRPVAVRCLSRKGITQSGGKVGVGMFLEEP
ncbi:MAG TPA: hypothetical protein PKO06_07950 [Candidatus Ozemobacteraceae bacterium]|nr:hypothetical protein [Candidatus Ozemobacteraceae bacterium]